MYRTRVTKTRCVAFNRPKNRSSSRYCDDNRLNSNSSNSIVSIVSESDGRNKRVEAQNRRKNGRERPKVAINAINTRSTPVRIWCRPRYRPTGPDFSRPRKKNCCRSSTSSQTTVSRTFSRTTSISRYVRWK